MGNPSLQHRKKEGKKEGVYHALREWLGTHTPKDGPFESQHCPSFTIRCMRVPSNGTLTVVVHIITNFPLLMPLYPSFQSFLISSTMSLKQSKKQLQSSKCFFCGNLVQFDNFVGSKNILVLKFKIEESKNFSLGLNKSLKFWEIPGGYLQSLMDGPCLL